MEEGSLDDSIESMAKKRVDKTVHYMIPHNDTKIDMKRGRDVDSYYYPDALV